MMGLFLKKLIYVHKLSCNVKQLSCICGELRQFFDNTLFVACHFTNPMQDKGCTEMDNSKIKRMTEKVFLPFLFTLTSLGNIMDVVELVGIQANQTRPPNTVCYYYLQET